MTPASVARFRDAEGPNGTEARGILRAFARRWKRSAKRCPPTFFVHVATRDADVAASSYGWDWNGRRFARDSIADGLGPDRRQQARDGAWDYYEQIFDAAHAALADAGAFRRDTVPPHAEP